ncbi:MAG: Smr/MutS family protein [Candidimonas sp.]
MNDMNLWKEYCKQITPLGEPFQKYRPDRMDGCVLPTEVYLDLHEMSADVAMNAVIAQIKKCSSSRIRILWVITGKGKILKRELPYWLERPEISNLILSYQLGRPKQGGEGIYQIFVKNEK